jgi:hypothetical protein
MPASRLWEAGFSLLRLRKTTGAQDDKVCDGDIGLIDGGGFDGFEAE